MDGETGERPWGAYAVLEDAASHKVTIGAVSTIGELSPEARTCLTDALNTFVTALEPPNTATDH